VSSRTRRIRGTTAFTGSPNATILVELLVDSDRRLLHRLLKKFAKTVDAYRALDRSVMDRSMRAWLKSLVCADARVYVNGLACPKAIRDRFASEVSQAKENQPRTRRNTRQLERAERPRIDEKRAVLYP
jgi:hypothetical protein